MIELVNEEEVTKIHGKTVEKLNEENAILDAVNDLEQDVDIDKTIQDIKKNPLPALSTNIFDTISEIKVKVDNGELKGTSLILALHESGVVVPDDDRSHPDVVSYIVKHMQMPGKGNNPVDISNKLTSIFRVTVTAHDILNYYDQSRASLTDVIDREKAVLDSYLMVQEEFYHESVYTNKTVAKDLFDLGTYADNAYKKGDIRTAIAAKKVRLDTIHKYQQGIGRLKPNVNNVTINKVDFNKIVNEVESLDDKQLEKVIKKYEKQAGIKKDVTIDAAWQNVGNTVEA